ncbi:hypothetical protein CO657_30060 (plasmid) [Rhizobium acidisoli]|uniref:Uncharacterized protein n=1 Tax=Rhizobium acidisoli TaxID=1538158 RepID=A0AAE5WTC0_9HYPH|nr:hypothetical protein CO657_30060 [Rhizobium acidisoli]
MKQIGEVYQPKSAKGNARKREISTVGIVWDRPKTLPKPSPVWAGIRRGKRPRGGSHQFPSRYEDVPKAGCGFWRASGGNASAIAAAPRPTIAEPMNSQE